MDKQEWLDGVRRDVRKLRSDLDSAERVFMEFLESVESSGRWDGFAPSFAAFLSKYDLCDPKVYANWLAAKQKVSVDVIEKIGIDAAKEAARVSDAKRADVVHEMLCTAEKNKQKVSQRTAQHIAFRHDPPPSKAVTEISRLRQLQIDVAARDKRIRELEKENAKLRADIERLSGVKKVAGARR